MTTPEDLSDDDLLGGPSTITPAVSDEDLLGGPVPVDDIDALGKPGHETKRLDWTSYFEQTEKGQLKETLHNLELIMKNDPRFAGLAQVNKFTKETVQRSAPGRRAKRRANEAKPVRQLEGPVWGVRDRVNGDLWSSEKDYAVRSILEAPRSQGGYQFKVSDRNLRAATVLSAWDKPFHPVQEYLESLAWDRSPRIDRLWIDYVNAPDDDYHREVARLMMIAAVTRIFEPGHKFDYCTVLEGLQGKRKSTLIQILARDWYAELEGTEFGDSKQAVEKTQGAWLLESAEMKGFNQADIRHIKAFISRTTDKVRLSYERRAEEFPRQFIIIATTNESSYLRDDSGGRRFLPVACRLADEEEIDTDLLRANVDQLWAEAVVAYREMRAAQPVGTLPLYLRSAAAKDTAVKLQESRREESLDDIYAGLISDWLNTPMRTGGFDSDVEGQLRNVTCHAEVWFECISKAVGSSYADRRVPQRESQIIGRAMRKIPGWEAKSQRNFEKYGHQRAYWRIGHSAEVVTLNGQAVDRSGSVDKSNEAKTNSIS